MKRLLTMKTKGMWFAVMLMAAVVVASCGSKKSVTSGTMGAEGLSEAAYLKEVMERTAPQFDSFSAKIRLSLSYGGENISVGGSVKMKRDEVIQLSLVAIGVVEAARIELTPKRLLVLDRIGRRYVELEYDELAFLKNSKIDFYTLQALFWNELFLPGVKHVTKRDMPDFYITRNDTQALLTADKGKRLSCSFLTALATGVLEESRIHVSASKENDCRLEWAYCDFQNLADRQFPSGMNLSLSGMGKPVKASFTFSRQDTRVEYTPLSIPNRYKQVEIADILKHLLTL